MLSPTLRTASLALALSPLALFTLVACGGGSETTGKTTTTTETTTTSGTSTTSATSTSTATATGTGGAGGATTTSTSTNVGGGAGGATCLRNEGPADGPRKVVISHPYDADANPAQQWEVLDHYAAGTLSKSGQQFRMGRAFWGEVVFTPDGKVGIVVQEDGSLGVFRFEGSGPPTVVHGSFKGSFYAGSVVMGPNGDMAYVLDGNWRENGGGIYRVSIGCDGQLTDLGMLAPSKLAYGMTLLNHGDRAVLAAADVLSSSASDNAFLLNLMGSSPSLVSGAAAFPDQDAIVSSVSRTHDENFVLIGDIAEFNPTTRLAVVRTGPGTVSPVQLFTDIEDPVSIVTSPYDNAAMVVSGYGNAFITLGYDPTNATTPFTVKGQVAYVGKKPELPSTAVQIERGGLKGRIYVSETSAVRQARFETNGTITDLGAFSFGDGLENIVGAIGVTP